MNQHETDIIKYIASTHETPTYVFDIPKLTAWVNTIRNNLTSNIGICFAMKANPFLTGCLSNLTDRLEVCSPGEYEICIREHISPDHIIVSGVNKTAESMRHIFNYSNGKGIYTIESPLQYEILKQCAIAYNTRIKLLLRLSSGNQFGMDESTLKQVLSTIQSDDIADVMGIHYYAGTQKSSKKIKHELEYLSSLGNTLKADYNLPRLDLEYGPGLAVDYFSPENEEDIHPLTELCEIISDINVFSNITIELGRYLAAYCGYYITRIMDIKQTDDTNYLIVDGGIHQLNYYGQMLGMKKPPLRHYSIDYPNSYNHNYPSNAQQPWTICGSLCTANDIIVRQAIIDSPVKIGDVIVFGKCGAYSVTEGMAMFLSRELPQVMLLNKDKTVTIARQLTQINIFNSRMEDK